MNAEIKEICPVGLDEISITILIDGILYSGCLTEENDGVEQ